MRRIWIRNFCSFLYLLSVLGYGDPAFSANITVNTGLDVLDGTDGKCSLREAVIASNEDLPSGGASGECLSGGGSDTIVISVGTFNLTIPGTDEDQALTGDLDILDSVEIDGAGQNQTYIDGNQIDRLFEIDQYPDITVTISDLTLTNGLTSDYGGAILNEEVLVLTNVTVEGCSAGGSGGGIHSDEDLQLDHCLIDGNSASGDGGGIDNDGVTSLYRTVVSQNSAGSYGGGIYSSDTLSVRESTVAWNTGYRGGGISTGNLLTISETTISSNSVSDDGGGIYSWGDVAVRNSTVSGNLAVEDGGAILNSGSMNLKNSTLADNTATRGSAIYNLDSLFVSNTIIQGACAEDALLSLGGNIESPGSTCGLIQASDQLSVTAGALSLGPLADNGGPTPTHSPILPSAAVDLGLNGVCEDLDQRGFPRPEDGDGNGVADCDVGSVEYGVPPIFTDGFESGDTSVWSSTKP